MDLFSLSENYLSNIFWKKGLLSRKENDWHIINNVSIRVLKTKNDFDNLNIEIEPCHFDPTFITEYNDNIDNFSKRE